MDTILSSSNTRSLFIDDVMELKEFLVRRVHELSKDTNVLYVSSLWASIASISSHSDIDQQWKWGPEALWIKQCYRNAGLCISCTWLSNQLTHTASTINEELCTLPWTHGHLTSPSSAALKQSKVSGAVHVCDVCQRFKLAYYRQKQWLLAERNLLEQPSHCILNW